MVANIKPRAHAHIKFIHGTKRNSELFEIKPSAVQNREEKKKSAPRVFVLSKQREIKKDENQIHSKQQ